MTNHTPSKTQWVLENGGSLFDKIFKSWFRFLLDKVSKVIQKTSCNELLYFKFQGICFKLCKTDSSQFLVKQNRNSFNKNHQK